MRRTVGLLMLAALLVAFADTAEARKHKKNSAQIVFDSDRTTGVGVNNPTGDSEIFVMKPDGTNVRQITFNTAEDYSPTVSPNLEKIAFVSEGIQQSNLEGDVEIYLMNRDGSGQQNLTNNAADIDDYDPNFSPDGKRIAYDSEDDPSSNPEGDYDVYLMNADGSNQMNLTDTEGDIDDYQPDFSPGGNKIAYFSDGEHEDGSNPEGDGEIYVMNADGTNRLNLTNTGTGIHEESPDFSPGGKKIAYRSSGAQFTNPEGDIEVYSMNADGSGKKNLTNTIGGISDRAPDFSPDGTKIAYRSSGAQDSNPEGDGEIYVMDSDGSSKKNLTNTAIGINEFEFDFAKAER